MTKPASFKRRAPAALSLLLESRAVLDLASLPMSLALSKFAKPAASDSLPIILFPGFGSDHRSIKPLQRYLQNLGYQAEDWGLGANLAGMNLVHTLEDLAPSWEIEFPADYSPQNYQGEGGVPYLCDQAIARVQRRAQQLGSPVVVIGWSLGGYIARECARELPAEVAQVITFGAPVYGGPKYSRAAAVFKAKNQDLDWIERSIERRERRPITQPVTAIYSKTDGIVSWTAALDQSSPNVQNIELNVSHLGMGFNAKVWRQIALALAAGNR